VLDRTEENAGFCVPPRHCPESGVLNVVRCRDNYPMMLSQPHFLDASTNYSTAVSGLEPNRTRHQTVIDIEPQTGTVVTSRLRRQFNVEIQHSLAFNETLKVRDEFVFPVAWTEEIFDASSLDLASVKNEIKEVEGIEYKKKVLTGISYAMIVVGFVILVCLLPFAIYWFVKKRKRDAENAGERQPLLTS